FYSIALLFSFSTTPTPAISTLSLHDALPISRAIRLLEDRHQVVGVGGAGRFDRLLEQVDRVVGGRGVGRQHAEALLELLHERNRSEEHTSELQSRENLVCRLLLEKKKHKS